MLGRVIGFWQKQKVPIFVVSILVVLSFFGLFLYFKIANSYNAVDVIGQNSTSGEVQYDSIMSNNLSPSANTLSGPAQIIVDTTSLRMFVADSSNNRVLIYNLNVDGSLVDKNADVVLGQNNLSSALVARTQNGLYKPWGLAYDAVNNRLFVADQGNNRILVFNTDPAVLTNGMRADFVLGQSDYNNYSANISQSGLDAPYHLAFDSTSSSLFVVDYNNNRVLVYNVSTSTMSNGMNATYVIGQTNFTNKTTGSAAATLNGPRSVLVDENGRRLFVSDWLNNRVTVYDLRNLATNMSASNVLGQPGFGSGTNGPTRVLFYRSGGMAFNSASNTLYVQDAYRVVTYDVSSIVNGEQMVSIIGQNSFTGIVLTASQNTFSSLTTCGIGFNQLNASLYVSDCGGNRIMIFDVNEIINGENAVDLIGQYDGSENVDWTTANINNQTPNANGFSNPKRILIDYNDHRMFISDSGNNRVLVYNLDTHNRLVDTTPDFVLGQADFNSNLVTTTLNSIYTPRGLAFDTTRKLLFVSQYSSNRVSVFDVNDISNNEDAVCVIGQSGATSTISGASSSTMSGPMGLYYDNASTTLYVAEFLNHRVSIYNLSTITPFGQPALSVLGQTGFNLNSSNIAQNRFARPVDVVMDERQHLFVTDGINARVLVFDVSSGVSSGQNATNVIGQADFLSKVTSVSQSGLYYPYEMSVDLMHNILYVSDTTARRITGYDITNISNNPPAIIVLGQNNYTESSVGVGLNNYSGNPPMTYDSENNYLYVSDSIGNRILVYKFIVPNIKNFDTAYLGLDYTSTALTSEYRQGDVSYSITSGTLPNGFTMTTSSGVISGAAEATGTYFFTIQATDANSIGSLYGENSYSISVNLPEVQFSEISTEMNEDVSSIITASVVLQATSTYNVTVDYDIYGGTALFGSDYILSTGTLTISSGTISKHIDINILSDKKVEGNEFLQVSLSNPVNARLGENTVFTHTILNDDVVVSGGGLPSAAFADIALPLPAKGENEGVFKIYINRGSTQTNDNTVDLSYNATKEITGLAFSRSLDFSKSSIEPYVKNKKWNLCGQEKCGLGLYSVYVRFFNIWGRSTGVVFAEIELVDKSALIENKSNLPIFETNTNDITVLKNVENSNSYIINNIYELLPKNYIFKNNLTYNSPLTKDIRYMQTYLKYLGYNVVSSGVFNIRTINALRKFQEDSNISPSVGFFGPITRLFVNKNLNLNR